MILPLVELGDICATTQGVQITKANTSDEIYDGGYRYLYIADFISDKSLSFVDDKFDAKKVTEHDLVMANTGSPGRVFKGKKGILSNNLFRITFDENIVNRNYLYLILSSPLFQGHLQQQMKGGIQKHLGHKTISRQKIPLPPLEEQKKIAEILDAADSLRQKDQQLVEHYDRLSQSLFLDMFGDSVENPKGWKVNKLKDLSNKIHSGNTPKGGSKVYVDSGITFLRSQNVWKNRLELDDVVYIDNKTHINMNKSSLKYQDILMTKTGRINTENSSLGRAAMFLGADDTANVNGHVYLIRLDENVIKEFVLFILTSIEYRDYIRSVCVGGIDKRQLNKDHLENFPIISPPRELQKQFIEQLKLIEKQKKLTQQSLKKSDALFNSLLQKAFKGELTLS